MSSILHIETSTDVCSVAVSHESECVFYSENAEGLSHTTHLAPFVEEAVSFMDSHALPIDAVAVSCGPGSYTGLRIGVSAAKGVCYGRDAKLIAIPTLKLLCVPILLHRELPDDAVLCPMIDARRLEVYDALYDRALNELRPTTADVIDEGAFASVLAERPVYFFGNGSDKCRGIISHPNAHFIEGINPLAKNMFPLAELQVAREQYEDVAYFEPFYLKEFVTTTPRKQK